MSVYAVLLKAPAAPPRAPAAFLSGRPGASRDSADAFLRNNPGFIARRLQLEEARALAALAETAGLGCMLVPEERLPAPPPAAIVEKVEPQNDGFYAKTASVRQFFRYDSITILAAAVYSDIPPASAAADLKPTLFTKLAALAGQPVPQAPEPRRETFLRADIIGGEGPQRLLLRPETLDFSALPARLPSSEANFRTLLDGLSAACFSAVKNHTLGAILSSAPRAPLKLGSPEAADLELSRLLLISSAARPGS